jgi:class 3 adenylate cyclase/tetratricopeptide (TPR) repeat protein
MGQVFRARDEVLRREVALKLLLARGGAAEEALREARAVALLDHENIVRLFDVSERSGIPGEPRIPFLVMECLEGESLAALLRRGRLDVGRALEILEGIAAGLAHAHERHLIHRDLKPSNVFLTPHGTVKLLDFGLAHLAPASTTPTPGLLQGGTPAYMAPEQWRGEPQDARTDVWAAGVVLYEMLTGTLPCPSPTREALRAWASSPAPVASVRVRRPELPPEVEPLVTTALAKEPGRRFRTARELLEEVRELEARLRPGGEAPRDVTPQRRQVTLVSCQLPGLAGAAASLDAEDVGELETAFHEACAQVIEEHGGSIASALAGEVLACFGRTQGREDDAERAVCAALQLTRPLRELLQHRLPHLALSVLSAKGSVHTDVLTVSAHSLPGEALKLTTGLAGQAGPGEVLLGETSWRLVRGAFEAEPLGPRSFEGLAGTLRMDVHRVSRACKEVLRFERTLVGERLTPLVGRERELRWLLERWEQARDARGAFVLLEGEAGIGKSRLTQELCERVAPAPALVLRVQCRSRFSTCVPPAFIGLLQEMARCGLEAAPPQRLRKLEELGLSTEDTHLLGLLLSLPAPEGSPVLQLTPERRQEKTFEVLAHILLTRARREAPVLLCVEDLHWADSTSLAFLGFLLERVEEERVLVLLSARPELVPDWPRPLWFHPLAVERLPVERAVALVQEVAGSRVLPEDTVQLLVRKTDGIPFFIEELTRMVLERAPAGPAGLEHSIPATLHELLLARLDMLPSRQKTLAQLGAVVGRDMPLSLLVALSEGDEALLRRELAELRDAGLLREEETPWGPAYQFRHALLQDAAYQSLPRGPRRHHHQRIARVLEARFPGLVEARPEVLAHHLTEAGELAPACGAWERAGMLAMERMANPEAMNHFTRALELLPALPKAELRLQGELRIRMALGMSMVEVRGLWRPEVVAMHARVRELLPEVGEAVPRLNLTWWGPFAYYMLRSEFHEVSALAEWLTGVAQSQGHLGLQVLGYRMQASSLFVWGRQREALGYLERAMDSSADFTLEEHRALAMQYWVEPRTAVLAYGAIVYALLGELEESRRQAREARLLAARVGHPHTTTFMLLYTAVASTHRGEAPETLRLAEKALSLSSERHYVTWRTWAELLRGWALSELGQPREGLTRVRQVFERWRWKAHHRMTPSNQRLLADMFLKLGRVEAALAAVQEGLGMSAVTGEVNVDAELHRQRGECLRRLGKEEEAKECFLRALAIAREQGARLFELRAAECLRPSPKE